MDPIQRIYNCGKEQLMDMFPSALDAAEMPMPGYRYELGLISFRKSDGLMIYAHIVEKSGQSTRVSMAPGLSYLKDRDSTGMPVSTIEEVMEKLDDALNKGA